MCVRESGRENKENYLMMPSASFNFVWPKESLYSTRKKTCSFFIMWQEKNSWKYSMHNADVSSTLEGFKSTISYSRVATICDFERPSLLVLKEYETDLQFLQLSQNLTTYSLLIYMFWTNWKCEIVFVLWQNNFSIATCTKHVNQQTTGYQILS